MKSKIFILIYFISSLIYAQQNEDSNQRKARSLLRDGNKLYQEKKYADAEVAYKKALEKNTTYGKAMFNLGNSLYQQNRTEESASLFEIHAKHAKDSNSKASSFHNLGNSYMKSKQYGLAVEAYKNSLRNNFKDDQTRYNLALAQKLMKEQQQNNNQKGNQPQESKDNKQENKDKNNDPEKDQKQDQNKDQKDNQNNEKQKSKQQQQPNQINQQQMEQLLNALNKEEEKTQKKVNAAENKGGGSSSDKDW